MGKIVVVIAVIVTLVASLSLFIFQQATRTGKVVAARQGEPRVVIDDFYVFRYKQDKLTGSFSAKLGHFVEPNVVEAFASVSAIRIRNNTTESMRCEAAHAQFDANHMRDLLRKDHVGIRYAEVEDQVQLGLKDDTLKTEHARYYASTETLSSKDPVQITGPNRSFVGEEGFKYNLKKETLELTGKVRGVVKPNAASPR